MATDVETLIIAVKTKDFAKAQKELNKLKKAAKEAEGATEGLKTKQKRVHPLSVSCVDQPLP